MHRIDTTTKAVDLFGPGKHGFQDGSPVTGVPATSLNAGWFNSAQEEICRVIEASGRTLDAGNNSQMVQALGITDHLLASTGYQRLPGGIIVQWGYTTTNSSGQATVTFPLAFPANFWRAIINPLAGFDAAYAAGAMISQGLAGFVQNIARTDNFVIAPAGIVVGWLAVGN